MASVRRRVNPRPCAVRGACPPPTGGRDLSHLAPRISYPGGRASGLTLIEVLIASLLLLAIALGVLPMFMRSMTQNVSAALHTEIANLARSRAEELRQLPFNSEPLTLLDGRASRVTSEYYSRSDRIWKALPGGQETPPADAEWLRTTTIRQYNLHDYLGSRAGDDEPTALPGNAPAQAVHLKEITVELARPQETGLAAFGAGRRFTVTTLKGH